MIKIRVWMIMTNTALIWYWWYTFTPSLYVKAWLAESCDDEHCKNFENQEKSRDIARRFFASLSSFATFPIMRFLCMFVLPSFCNLLNHTMLICFFIKQNHLVGMISLTNWHFSQFRTIGSHYKHYSAFNSHDSSVCDPTRFCRMFPLFLSFLPCLFPLCSSNPNHPMRHRACCRGIQHLTLSCLTLQCHTSTLCHTVWHSNTFLPNNHKTCAPAAITIALALLLLPPKH